jgi:hypothetical protein
VLSSKNRNFFKHLPKELKALSRHWSDEEASLAAAEFLSQGSNSILDLGSGVGSFCVLGALNHSDKQFTGIEQRKDLVEVAQNQAKLFQLANCSFVHGDIRTIDFSEYNGFYFFNSFLELLDPTCIIDEGSEVNWEEYISLTKFLFNSLRALPSGVRLVTYDVSPIGIPGSYKKIDSRLNGLLVFYCKSNESNGVEELNRVELERYMHSIQQNSEG